jgi:starch synthase
VKRKLKILYVTAEISPYANAGGLGEVGRAFPCALKETGRVEVRRVMPLYKTVNQSLKYLEDFPVPMEQGYETCILKTDPEELAIPTYFIGNDRYFYRDRIYACEDDGFRFFFFCRAVIEMLKRISFKPDI